MRESINVAVAGEVAPLFALGNLGRFAATMAVDCKLANETIYL
jgi:hypothetical protein